MKETTKSGIIHPVMGDAVAKLIYGFDYQWGKMIQKPRFTMLINIISKKITDQKIAYCIGHIPEEINRWFADEYYLAKWHLFDIEGVPCHYRETLKFWHDMAHRKIKVNLSRSVNPIKSIENVVVLSATPDLRGEFINMVKNNDFKVIDEWANARLPILKNMFYDDMSRAGLL